MRYNSLFFLGYLLLLLGTISSAGNEANAETTLEAIRVSDYVTYSHIALELSDTNNTVQVEPLHSSNIIRVRLRGSVLSTKWRAGL